MFMEHLGIISEIDYNTGVCLHHLVLTHQTSEPKLCQNYNPSILPKADFKVLDKIKLFKESPHTFMKLSSFQQRTGVTDSAFLWRSCEGFSLQTESLMGFDAKWKLLSPVRLFAIPWTMQSMEFSRPDTGMGSLSLLQVYQWSNILNSLL